MMKEGSRNAKELIKQLKKNTNPEKGEQMTFSLSKLVPSSGMQCANLSRTGGSKAGNEK
jgi:hypothetical protein